MGLKEFRIGNTLYSYSVESGVLTEQQDGNYKMRPKRVHPIILKIADTIFGVKKVKIRTESDYELTVYTSDGTWGYDRTRMEGDYWEKTSDGYWWGDDTQEEAMEIDYTGNDLDKEEY